MELEKGAALHPGDFPSARHEPTRPLTPDEALDEIEREHPGTLATLGAA